MFADRRRADAARAHDVACINSRRPNSKDVRGVVMSYRAGGQDYQTTYDDLLLICADPVQPLSLIHI